MTMNRLYAMVVIFLTFILYDLDLKAELPEVKSARRHGAQGQVTFRITDSTGKPVEKSEVMLAFPHSDAYDDVEISKGATDTNGIFIASGKTKDSVIYDIKKDGYYKTRGVYWFYRPSGLDANKNSAISPTSGEYWLYHQNENAVKDGRWQPWNPTNTVVLKEHRNPVPMYAKNIDMAVPIRDKSVGFDLEAGDWVAPHGKGIKSDIFFTDIAKIQDLWTGYAELTITCSNRLDGFYRIKKDVWSEFKSVYEAPLTGYQREMKFPWETTKERDIKDERLPDTEYLIFRVRTVIDDKGNIVSARYGKIYGPLEFAVGKKHHVRFTYYFNPDGARNLEFDPKRNLFQWKHDARENVHMP